MNNKIVFATTNEHKVAEVSRIIGKEIQFLSLSDIGFSQEIIEDGSSFEENAKIKATTVFSASGLPVISEDSGLVVPALNGAPGIYSARYAGDDADHERNIDQLLNDLEGHVDRSAYYHATCCFISSGHSFRFFSGQCTGQIAHHRTGTGGFGYDPVFIPDGYDQSFGTLDPGIKNRLSHRREAFLKWLAYFRDNKPG